MMRGSKVLVTVPLLLGVPPVIELTGIFMTLRWASSVVC